MKFLPDAERSRASLHPICHPLQFNYQKTTNKHRKNTKTLPCYRVLLLVGWLCQKPRLKFQFCTVQLFPCQIWWGHKCASRARVGKSKKISYLIPSGLVVSGVVFFGALSDHTLWVSFSTFHKLVTYIIWHRQLLPASALAQRGRLWVNYETTLRRLTGLAQLHGFLINCHLKSTLSTGTDRDIT